jgi:hypothetical protein
MSRPNIPLVTIETAKGGSLAPLHCREQVRAPGPGSYSALNPKGRGHPHPARQPLQVQLGRLWCPGAGRRTVLTTEFCYPLSPPRVSGSGSIRSNRECCTVLRGF